jgi:hypothetical protein
MNVQIRRPGEIVPGGVSVTETSVANYVRIRHGVDKTIIRIPKQDPKSYGFEELHSEEFLTEEEKNGSQTVDRGEEAN